MRHEQVELHTLKEKPSADLYDGPGEGQVIFEKVLRRCLSFFRSFWRKETFCAIYPKEKAKWRVQTFIKNLERTGDIFNSPWMDPASLHFYKDSVKVLLFSRPSWRRETFHRHLQRVEPSLHRLAGVAMEMEVGYWDVDLNKIGV